MPPTPGGIVYPNSSDHTRLWEHMQDLAESVESAALAAWIPYTPSFVMGAHVQGNADRTGAYKQIGKTVHFWARIAMGTTSAVGNGAFSITLPVNAESPRSYAGVTGLMENLGVASYAGNVILSTTAASVYTIGAVGAFAVPGPSSPFPWGTGDSVEVHGTYEAA